jgi:hypothetical protein
MRVGIPTTLKANQAERLALATARLRSFAQQHGTELDPSTVTRTTTDVLQGIPIDVYEGRPTPASPPADNPPRG